MTWSREYELRANVHLAEDRAFLIDLANPTQEVCCLSRSATTC